MLTVCCLMSRGCIFIFIFIFILIFIFIFIFMHIHAKLSGSADARQKAKYAGCNCVSQLCQYVVPLALRYCTSCISQTCSADVYNDAWLLQHGDFFTKHIRS